MLAGDEEERQDDVDDEADDLANNSARTDEGTSKDHA